MSDGESALQKLEKLILRYDQLCEAGNNDDSLLKSIKAGISVLIEEITVMFEYPSLLKIGPVNGKIWNVVTYSLSPSDILIYAINPGRVKHVPNCEILEVSRFLSIRQQAIKHRAENSQASGLSSFVANVIPCDEIEQWPAPRH